MKLVKDKKGSVLASLFKPDEYAGNTEKSGAYTDSKETLRVGSLFFKKGQGVKPHIHKQKPVEVMYPVVELILVLNGEGTVDVYDEKKELVETLTINTGDMLLLKRGGHGFHFKTSNARVLHIRPGRYTGKEKDKEMI